jgi:hypothetical protein
MSINLGFSSTISERTEKKFHTQSTDFGIELMILKKIAYVGI